MGDETRARRVLPHPSVLISPTTRQFISHWGLRSAVSNSLDRYLPGRHDQPCGAVVVSAALGEWLRGFGSVRLHEVSHAGRNGTQARGRGATSFGAEISSALRNRQRWNPDSRRAYRTDNRR